MYAFSEMQVNIILPILIIFISLIIKVVINNDSSWTGFGEEFIKFPSDISLLSLTFVSTFMITSSNNTKHILSGIVYLFVFFLISIITYFLTKKASDIYLIDNKSNKDTWNLIILFIISCIISIPVLIVSILLLIIGVK
ncbi:hypothetical protein J1907_09820 [Lysinibacillus sphaericus]|uniref:hypothetical protein n=1 Tax=Lysinibacillus sphaericus TaxID=1421 RepID=UPI00056ADE18|nr:hypothetical protein [Lysinibacillus sphaericus]QTB24308.1 hypothetical protein J1907_09820 [Lysinibacillus sphaericus]